MSLPRRRFLHLASGAVVLPAASRIARAQTYPTRPVRIIAGAPPGGILDIHARLTGQWFAAKDSAVGSGLPLSHPTTGSACCCARATSGHAAALPSRVSLATITATRRRTRSPASAGSKETENSAKVIRFANRLCPSSRRSAVFVESAITPRLRHFPAIKLVTCSSH